MLLYSTDHGLVAVTDGRSLRLADLTIDALLQNAAPLALLQEYAARAKETDATTPQVLLPPIGSQDVWAAGVTYFRSRDARMLAASTRSSINPCICFTARRIS